MAYTVTELHKDVIGSQRVKHLLVAADAVSGVVNSGFQTLYSAHITPKSMATAGVKAKINCTTAAAASNGTLNIADAASGDDMYVTLYGR